MLTLYICINASTCITNCDALSIKWGQLIHLDVYIYLCIWRSLIILYTYIYIYECIGTSSEAIESLFPDFAEQGLRESLIKLRDEKEGDRYTSHTCIFIHRTWARACIYKYTARWAFFSNNYAFFRYNYTDMQVFLSKFLIYVIIVHLKILLW